MLLIQSLLLVGCLFLSGTKAQLSEGQVDQLSMNEKILNKFMTGFRIEDISTRYYGCLWEQHKFGINLNKTHTAFQEEDPAKVKKMFPLKRDKLFNVTNLISDDLAGVWFNCLMATWDSYVWGAVFIQGFNEDNVYSYPVSVLQ